MQIRLRGGKLLENRGEEETEGWMENFAKVGKSLNYFGQSLQFLETQT